MKSAITHTVTLAIGLCLGLYIATKVILTGDAALENNNLVGLKVMREKGYNEQADKITDYQIDNKIQELKYLSQSDISLLFKCWTPKSIETVFQQREVTLKQTYDCFKDKKSFLSEDTKQYLEKEATK